MIQFANLLKDYPLPSTECMLVAHNGNLVTSSSPDIGAKEVSTQYYKLLSSFKNNATNANNILTLSTTGMSSGVMKLLSFSNSIRNIIFRTFSFFTFYLRTCRTKNLDISLETLVTTSIWCKKSISKKNSLGFSEYFQSKPVNTSIAISYSRTGAYSYLKDY